MSEPDPEHGDSIHRVVWREHLDRERDKQLARKSEQIAKAALGLGEEPYSEAQQIRQRQNCDKLLTPEQLQEEREAGRGSSPRTDTDAYRARRNRSWDKPTAEEKRRDRDLEIRRDEREKIRQETWDRQKGIAIVIGIIILFIIIVMAVAR
jgi:hypothetical protein